MSNAVLQAILLLAAIVCAYRAVTAPRILTSTIYLASVSAMAAVVLYLAGAHQLAVIELSVGAGLVTVLLVYAISVVGDEALDLGSVIPKPIAVGLAGLVVILVGWMGLAIAGKAAGGAFQPLVETLWGQRVLDVWIQMVLIFAGVLGILGLLAEGKVARTAHGATQAGRGARVVKVVPATACGSTPPPAETAARNSEVHV